MTLNLCYKAIKYCFYVTTLFAVLNYVLEFNVSNVLLIGLTTLSWGGYSIVTILLCKKFRLGPIVLFYQDAKTLTKILGISVGVIMLTIGFILTYLGM